MIGAKPRNPTQPFLTHCTRSHRSAIFLAIVVAAFGASIALAHNSWLVSAKDRASSGESVRVAFVTGEHFPVSENATAPERVASWFVRGVHDRRDLTGYSVEGQELALTTQFDQPGVYVIAAALRPRFIELAPDKFEDYLREERAETCIQRRAEGKRDQPGREFYAKFSKCFVEMGDAPDSDATFSAPVGLAFEIVPLSNPCRLFVGEAFEARVFLNGAPAAGVRVCAGNDAGSLHEYTDEAVSDRDGIVRFRFEKTGQWFLRAHRIEPITPNQSAALLREDAQTAASAPSAVADWSSQWTSISFRVRGAEEHVAAPASQPDEWPQKLTSNDRHYRVAFRTRPRVIPLHDLFQIDVHVSDAGGVPVGDDTDLLVDAAMPEHEHGMNTQPTVRRVGPGRFTVNGMLFHMPGNWELYFDVRRRGVTERAQYSAKVE